MSLNITLPEAGGLPAVAGGLDIGDGEIAALQKALTAGYGTDSAQFTGGSAFRIQSLDKTMKSTIQSNDDFVLFNMLAKQGAGATVDEWTERNGIGGFLGGTTNSETGVIAGAQGSYQRKTAQVKYLMTRCEVSLVATLGRNIVEAKAAEAEAGSLRLLTDAEYLSFFGNSAVNPFEFDGIYTQIEAAVAAGTLPGTSVVDMGGKALTDISSFNKGAAAIRGYGNFGKPSDIFMSMATQADLDSSLDPAFRVPLTDIPGGGIMLGSPVMGIRTSFGNIKNRPGVFQLDEPQLAPFEALPGMQAIAVANNGLKPQAVTAAAGSNASSTFTTPRAGNYYYLVTGLNAAGQSTGSVTSQVAITAGQAVTLTIQPSAGGNETGYAIYRSRQNGTNTPSDFRLMTKVAKAATGNTTYVDANQNIPGAVRAGMVNMSPGADNISWRQLLPMTEFQLFPTSQPTLPWAQLLFGYLRIAKLRQNISYKNIITSSQVWRPFTAE